jgi:hypothetical protein
MRDIKEWVEIIYISRLWKEEIAAISHFSSLEGEIFQ